MFSQIVSFLLQASIFVNILFAAVVIFSERRNPAVTWAWLMVVFLIPYFGFALYMLIGIEGRKYRTFAAKYRQNAEMIAEIEAKNLAGLDFIRSPSKEEYVANFKKTMKTRHISDLVYLNAAAGGGYLTRNNKVDILTDGKAKFSALLDDINNAVSFIHVQYFIFRNSELGRSLIDALAAAAQRGVEVKLLIDGMGNLRTRKRIFRPLIEAGGELGVFLPPRFIRINFQNHRKLCVIDGSFGYLGGFNVGDEYMGHSKRFGAWRDLHLRVFGDATKDLELQFMMDWNFAQPKRKIEASDKYFPVIAEDADTPNLLMQVVSGGPDTKWANIYNAISKMISEANESIHIQSPYFAPDENIFESLKIAALSGIKVSIMIPANPDHPFVKPCALSYLWDLMEVGVKCYEYTEGFIHSKMIMIDDIAASVGTTNMDMRSFKLNFEVNAFVYDRNVTEQLKAQFERDLEHSRELTMDDYRNRSWWQKIKEALSRLLSPLI